MSKANGQEDFVAEGFHLLPETIVEHKAPRLTEPPKFAAKTDGQKYLYYRKVAATMNHSAYLITLERDNMNDLLFKKEQQLTSMAAQVDQNNQMLQSEVTRMNETKQSYHAEISRLLARIKELEDADD